MSQSSSEVNTNDILSENDITQNTQMLFQEQTSPKIHHNHEGIQIKTSPKDSQQDQNLTVYSKDELMGATSNTVIKAVPGAKFFQEDNILVQSSSPVGKKASPSKRFREDEMMATEKLKISNKEQYDLIQELQKVIQGQDEELAELGSKVRRSVEHLNDTPPRNEKNFIIRNKNQAYSRRSNEKRSGEINELV